MPSLYGRVKLEAEKYLTDWGARKNTKIHIIRIPAVIGQNGHETFLVRLVTAIKNGEALTINSTKSRFNHAVYLDDVCAFMKALSCDCKYSTLSILGASCPLTLCEVMSLVQQRLCIQGSNVEETGVISNVINTRSAELLGFKSMKTQEIIIKQIQLLGF
jgi:nucleoside-diphosphate-sugar epimerase